ncbi:complement C1q-like protein 2 [Saccostrea cucullata]|uniref:complement C1q-like protein 2 n=1 Tax=Saccostrea cuccullata TaxID=36930 RepID=UPI002ED027BD
MSWNLNDCLLAIGVTLVAGFFYLQERRIKDFNDLYLEIRHEVNSMKLAHKDEIHALRLKMFDYLEKQNAKNMFSNMKNNLEERIKLTEETHTNNTRRVLDQIDGIESRLGLPVAFYSRLSQHHHSSPPGTVLKFDDVKLNIGSGYNPVNGKFSASENGLYFFTWNYLIQNGNNAYIGAYVNGKQEVDTCTYSHGNPFNLATGSLVVKLTKGDEVWLQVFYKQAEFLHSTYTFFMGYKLSALPSS